MNRLVNDWCTAAGAIESLAFSRRRCASVCVCARAFRLEFETYSTDMLQCCIMSSLEWWLRLDSTWLRLEWLHISNVCVSVWCVCFVFDVRASLKHPTEWLSSDDGASGVHTVVHTTQQHLTSSLLRRCFQMRNSMEKKRYSQWKKTHDSIVETSHEHTAYMHVCVCVCAKSVAYIGQLLLLLLWSVLLPFALRHIFSSFTKISLAIMCVRAIFPCSIRYYYYYLHGIIVCGM